MICAIQLICPDPLAAIGHPAKYSKGNHCVQTSQTLDRRKLFAVLAFNKDLLGPEAKRRLEPCNRAVGLSTEDGATMRTAQTIMQKAKAVPEHTQRSFSVLSPSHSISIFICDPL